MPDNTLLCGKRGQPGAVMVAMYRGWQREPERGWSKKPDFIRRRLRERFIEPIEQTPTAAKNGFAVMALSCLLVETLEAFYQGWTSTRTHSAESFPNFFGRDPAFSCF